MRDFVVVDGRLGEGGGQVLRTSLSLSATLGVPVRIEHVRAGRAKPGLLRQHLTAARAAAEISGGELRGAELGSATVELVPGTVRAGEYRFAIGSAGSTTLVLQTVLLPLLLAGGASLVRVEGGTHNPNAPSFDFLARSFAPQLGRAGARVQLELERPGFHPAGGGVLHARIDPLNRATPFALEERGAPGEFTLAVLLAHLDRDIAEREWLAAQRVLHWKRERLRHVDAPHALGPGNAVAVELAFERVTAVFTDFGERGRRAEDVGRAVARLAKRYLAHDAPVDEHLADQLLLPLALLAGGTYRTSAPSAHTLTNAAVIDRFLPGAVTITAAGDGARIDVAAR